MWSMPPWRRAAWQSGSRSTRGDSPGSGEPVQEFKVPIRMADNTDQETKRPLSLRTASSSGSRKPIETSQVRQSFPHGRSKTVTVEVRKKRVLAPGQAETGGTQGAQPTARAPSTDGGKPAAAGAGRVRPVVLPHTLTEEERAHRVRTLADARKADEEARRRAVIED